MLLRHDGWLQRRVQRSICIAEITSLSDAAATDHDPIKNAVSIQSTAFFIAAAKTAQLSNLIKPCRE